MRVCSHLIERRPIGTHQSQVFCLPSWSEGFGIVYLEAMACSKPVIGVAGQGIDAVIREHSTGFLVEPKDVQSVVNALRQFMADDSLRMQMGPEEKKWFLRNLPGRIVLGNICNYIVN